MLAKIFEKANNNLQLPLKIYRYGMYLGFGATFATNLAYGLKSKSSINAFKEPELFGVGLLGKSLYYGLFWPAIPYKCYYKRSAYYNLGNSFLVTRDDKGNLISADFFYKKTW